MKLYEIKDSKYDFFYKNSNPHLCISKNGNLIGLSKNVGLSLNLDSLIKDDWNPIDLKEKKVFSCELCPKNAYEIINNHILILNKNSIPIPKRVDTSKINHIIFSYGSKINNAKRIFSNIKKLRSVDTTPFTNATNANSIFYGCSGLIKINTTPFNNLINASWMFWNCKGLTKIDTTPFTKVTNADSMFRCCSKLTEIDTTPFTNVTIAQDMFTHCSNLTKINTTPFTSVINTEFMFYECINLTSAIISKEFPIGTSTFSGCTNLIIITYTGTKSDWAAVISGLKSGNDVLKTAKVTCSDGVYRK